MTIRIAVVGDDRVGKSSLIQAFVREVFDEHPPDLLPEINIPADITVDAVATVVVDTQVRQMKQLK